MAYDVRGRYTPSYAPLGHVPSPYATAPTRAPQAPGTPRDFYRGKPYNDPGIPRLPRVGGGLPASRGGQQEESADTDPRLNGPEFYRADRPRTAAEPLALEGARPLGLPAGPPTVRRPAELGAGPLGLPPGAPGLPPGPIAAPPAGHRTDGGHFVAPYSRLAARGLKKYQGLNAPTYVATPLPPNKQIEDAVDVRSWTTNQSRAQRRRSSAGATRAVFDALYD